MNDAEKIEEIRSLLKEAVASWGSKGYYPGDLEDRINIALGGLPAVNPEAELERMAQEDPNHSIDSLMAELDKIAKDLLAPKEKPA